MGMGYPPWLTEVVSRPIGLGKVFYVRHGTSNDNNGVNPDTPFATITYALSQCVSGRNDYIIVLNGWSEDTPIEVNKTRLHIIGLGCESMPLVTLTSNANSAIFGLDGGDGDFEEIAGFDLGGGDAHGGIEPLAGTADLVYIHHCNFGSEYCGDTPLYGVWLPVAFGAKAWRIEDCKFFGNLDTGGGQITGDGVYIEAGVKHEVRNCVFMALPGVAINADSVQALIIRGNEIVLDTDTIGAGITLGAASTRCLVSYNKAAWGEADGGAACPYLDSAGVDANAWTANYECEALTGPD